MGERIEVPHFDRHLVRTGYSRRWRRPYGRAVHAAAIYSESSGPNRGLVVVRCCEPGVIEWVNHDIAGRYVLPDSENVTCAACKKRLSRRTPEPRATTRGDQTE